MIPDDPFHGPPNYAPAANQHDKIAVSGLWKIFGPAEHIVKHASQAPSVEALRRQGIAVAVANADFSIQADETFVIMGLSGSGKSTLLRCLCQLLPPTIGRVLLDGEDLAQVSARRLIEIRRRRMGMVFQNYALLPHRTVLDNIAFPLEIGGMAAAARLARARELAALVGLQAKTYAFPTELSGGQQQRVGIARSLAIDPEIWLLDEPFSALDPLIRRELQGELIRLRQLKARTIIFITHDFDEAARLADRIAIMRDGKIVQIGTPAALILTPADDYVAAFTRHADRGRVLTVRSVMTPLAATGRESGTVTATTLILPATLPLATAMKRAWDHRGAIGIVGDDDRLIGTVTVETLVNSALGAA